MRASGLATTIEEHIYDCGTNRSWPSAGHGRHGQAGRGGGAGPRARHPLRGAEALGALGAGLVLGDLDDRGSLVAAATGARAVFSVQTPDMADLYSDSEQVHGKNFVEAARAAGVAQFVHSSVSGAGEYHRNAPGWEEGRWNGHYWESKAYTEELVRAAGFEYWTTIKPAFFMENFVRPSFLFANWVEDRLFTAVAAETRFPLVAVRDIGAAGAAIVDDPERFDGVDVELAGDYLTMAEVAEVLSDALGTRIGAPSLSPAEALEQGLMAELVNSQEWMNEVGSPARPEHARELGLATTDFKTWADETLRPSSRSIFGR